MAVTYTFVDGTTALAGEVNQNFTECSTKNAIKLNPFSQIGKISLKYTFIMPFTSIRWQSEDWITTDAGTTSAASNSTEEFGWLNLGDKTKGFSCSSDGATIRYTTDSGANWTTSTTSPANRGTCTGGDYSLDGLIYLSGTASSGTGLWYSTNDGVDFTQVSSGTHDFIGVGMHDATHGIAIHLDGSIWYTTNGTTWADGGHGWAIDSGMNRADIYVYASGANITDFKCLILERKSNNTGADYGPGNVGYYDGTSDVDAASEIYHAGAPAPYGRTTNFCLLDNGSLCFVYASASENTSPENVMSATLVVCTNPTASVITGSAITTAPTFYQIPLGLVGQAGDYDLCLQASDSMNQYDTNKVLINLNCRKLFQIDLGGIV